MKTLLNRFIIGAILGFTVALAVCASGKARADYVGQSVIWKYDSSHLYTCVISKVTDVPTREVNLVCASHVTASWWNSVAGSTPNQTVAAVVWGTGDNRWFENPDLPSFNAGTAYTPSFTIGGSAIQLDPDYDTELYLTVTITGTLSLTGGFDGSVSLLCDANTTPSAIVQLARRAITGTVVVGVSITDTVSVVLRHRVKAGNYCRITETDTTGTPTQAVTIQVAQQLGS